MTYTERTQINVSEHIEKKGRFSYLSWVFALDELQKQDESATWDYQPHIIYPDGLMMVTTTVTAFGKTLQMLLPVMDHNNKAIKNPDAFAINKAYMRCLAKNVAAHGIGMYIFAGEDLPNADDTPEEIKQKKEPIPELKPVKRDIEAELRACMTEDQLKEVFLSLTKSEKEKYLALKDELKEQVFPF